MPDDELLDLAPVVGLDALDAAELAELQGRLDAETPEVRAAFDRQVAATREAMAGVSHVTATTPPETLRDRVLAAARAEAEPATSATDEAQPTATVIPLHRRRRLMYAAAAAVVAVAIGAIGWVVGVATTSEDSSPQTAEQVFAAKDVRTSSGDVATGRATVTYSPTADAGVLVMNDVPPPEPGTVYQMWLVGPTGETSAGTMTDQDVAPSTTAVIDGLGDATALAFTVEPPGGSTQPTGPLVAELPLS
ncbi:anti-sigma factor [Gordonia sp. HNM0687]|uniref:Regulator of SigK n=1 Tax=Gordonia mangrovi TaxID=2665643 RepID=A0A6L7GXC5_9ACTN|nr:anti-sigma factor [Gordonia mangrovi]MXP24293.1 anti-sigma factor [Gordonia mangrovi]UVF79888.1 anti-sigma factor [Gordonia mangrovi]